MKENQYKDCAQQLIDILDRDNVISVAHCATRLRLVLKDESKIDKEALENLGLVKGMFSNAGQFQIILGSGTVDEVYKEFVKLSGLKESSKQEVKQQADQKMNSVQKIVKMLSDVFVPIIPALVASGLLMGINNVLTANDLFFAGKSLIDAYPNLTDLAGMINMFANAAYTFLPILVGFSATKMFGGNPYLGAVIGMIMVHPDLLNAYGYGQAVLDNAIPTWNVLGLTIEKVGYQGTVLPVLASSFILAWTEKKLHRVIPEAIDNLVTPLLSIFITSILTFIVIGGIMRGAGDLLTSAILWLHDTLGVVGGAVFGLFYAPLTMTGMHHSLLPIDIQLIAAGGSFLLAIAACNNVAQGGAALATMVISKDKKIKGIAGSSGISALLGITEPAMFGVNLKLRYPFYAAMVGSAVGCAYVTLTNVVNVSPGAAGIIGFVCVQNSSMTNFMIGVLLAFIVGFLMTFTFSKTKLNNK